MKIALDAMGGDFAPEEIVKGAIEATKELDVEIILVGDEASIKASINNNQQRVNIIHAPQVINMYEQPALAVRRKRQSSIVIATQLVKERQASALVSAGSTGAAMAASLLFLGRIPGIDRPAIASVLPTKKGVTVLLDSGANVDCKPHNLLQFGIMGHLYAEKILKLRQPRAGLLNVGEEETKGNETTLAAFSLLKESKLIFTGNIEGRDLFNGTADVVICDGFVGNIVLKTCEGIAGALIQMAKEEVTKSYLARVGALMAAPALRKLAKRLDYTEYGGAPLLGVNGIVIICHGRSQAKAIKNAIKLAQESAKADLVSAIRASTEGLSEGTIEKPSPNITNEPS